MYESTTNQSKELDLGVHAGVLPRQQYATHNGGDRQGLEQLPRPEGYLGVCAPVSAHPSPRRGSGAPGPGRTPQVDHSQRSVRRALTVKQVGFLCYRVRSDYDEWIAPAPRSRGEYEFEGKWLDFQQWIEEHVSFEDATEIIGTFKSGRPDEAFDLLLDLGLPVTPPEGF